MGCIDAVIYARVSSREQEQEGYSIPAQLKALRAYASKHGFKVIEEFVDIETAKTSGRARFGDMVAVLSKRTIPRRILVEKTDRLYRNLRDCVTLEDLDAEIHLVKEGQVISKDSRSQDKLAHGLQLLIARNYVENLREEVKKGMREKAEQGMYPGRAPFGYRNDRASRSLELHPENSLIVSRIYELYASGSYSLSAIRTAIRNEFGKTINRAYLHTILMNRFYIGQFLWAGRSYIGNYPTFISSDLFDQTQAAMRRHNKPKYRTLDIAFRGLLRCAYDNCTVTAELKKGKYVYYRCTGYRGKCALPRFREEEISDKLADIMKNIHIPDTVLAQLKHEIEHEAKRIENDSMAKRRALDARLVALRSRMDRAYRDKLDGRIPEDFWERQMFTWHEEERHIKAGIEHLERPSASRVFTISRILELANKAYFLYVTQKPSEQAKLMRMVLLNCSIDEVSVYPTYRKPFEMIFERAKSEEWSGRADLNCRPLAPQASALPG
jgi:site-specific DNA recombinase